MTKAGDVGVVYRLQGQDYEGLDHAQRRCVVHRFEEPRCGCWAKRSRYQYFFKRQAPPMTAEACESPVVDQAVRASRLSSQRKAGSCSKWTSSSC